MCRVEERIYISADGHRSKFEEHFPCDKSRGGKLCSNVKTRTAEYHPKRGSLSRDDTPSPNNPPTPTGTGTYLVQQRRPSGSGARPSTRDGIKAIKPEIVIEFGSKKDKTKTYPSISVSTGAYKRSSLGASSIGSNDLAIDSPGSDASHTVRTGFPEAPLPPPAAFGHSKTYVPTPTDTHGRHHRQTSSTSSFTGSSRTPSLYVTSDDYDSPTHSRNAMYPPTIVHNQPVAAAPSSPSRTPVGGRTGSYRTSVIAPQTFAHDTHTPDGLFPLDYGDLADRSGSSHASSGAPESKRRPKSSDDRRKKEDDRRRQEEAAKEENTRQVRFDLGRHEARARERAENTLAEKERIRAEDREEAHRRKQKERERQEREDRVAKERSKERSKPPTKPIAVKQARRMSMTQDQIEEQRRLLAAEDAHMQEERLLAEAREREERNALFRQQQETPGYYDPRGGDRTLSNVTSAVARRNSVSRRNSVTAPSAPTGLKRSDSTRRTQVVQPNPPPPSQDYSARAPSTRQKAGPPVSFPTNFNQDYIRPTSARRSSISHENPFAPNPTVAPPTTHDPWDVRVVQDALPTTTTRPPVEGRYTLQQRGEAVINRSVTHSQAQQATRALRRTTADYDNVFETDSDSYESYPPSRLGQSGKGKKKY